MPQKLTFQERPRLTNFDDDDEGEQGRKLTTLFRLMIRHRAAPPAIFRRRPRHGFILVSDYRFDGAQKSVHFDAARRWFLAPPALISILPAAEYAGAPLLARPAHRWRAAEEKIRRATTGRMHAVMICHVVVKFRAIVPCAPPRRHNGSFCVTADAHFCRDARRDFTTMHHTTMSSELKYQVPRFYRSRR